MSTTAPYIYSLAHNPTYYQSVAVNTSNEPAQLNELALLSRFYQAGIAITPMHIISPEVESSFYQLNNLPEQLSQLFRQVDLHHPDEDDIEEIALQAQALLQQSYLLDEVIDAFYNSLEQAPPWLSLRYPYPYGQASEAVEHKVLRGRPSLMRLKALWRSRWSYQALWDRLEQRQSIALPAYPVLMHAPIAVEMLELAASIRKIFAEAVVSLAPQQERAYALRVFVDEAGAIAHIRF